MTTRQEKVSSLIQKLTAEFLQNESNKISLITVTKSDISKDLKKGTIFITVFPEDKEKIALAFVKRQLKDLRLYLRKNLKIKFAPFLDVKIDIGEKNREEIENISRSLKTKTAP